MNIEALAKRRVELQQTLDAIAYCNIYGRSVEDLIELELSKIKARKELNEVVAQILAYENGALLA